MAILRGLAVFLCVCLANLAATAFLVWLGAGWKEPSRSPQDIDIPCESITDVTFNNGTVHIEDCLLPEGE